MADYRCSDREQLLKQMKEYYGDIDPAELGSITCGSFDNPEDARECICDDCPVQDNCSGPIEERQDTPGQMMLFPEVSA